MNKTALCITMGLLPLLVIMAQDPNGNYNPFVNGGTISPSPLIASEDGGKGTFSFNIGNKGSDPLKVFDNHKVMLTVTLSCCTPDNVDPLLAISGSYAELFNWNYNVQTVTYSGIQISELPANSSGSIEIAFKVTRNTSTPGMNGFNVNIAPSPYQNISNKLNDDAFSSYTYTESVTSIKVFENSQVAIYPNPSHGEFTIDLNEASGEYQMEVLASDGTCVLKETRRLNAAPFSLILEDYSPGMYLIRLFDEERSFMGELILE